MARRLLYLNGVAIAGVILFHTTGWGFTAMFAWTDRYQAVTVPNFDQMGSFWYLFMRVIEQVVVATIPAFLFVSGYFIAFAAGRQQRTIGWPLVGARVRGLLIPYLFWTAVLLALALVQGITYSPVQIGRMLLTGNISPAYYYIPLLIQFYVLAPFLVPLARRYWAPLLAVTAVLQIAIHGTQQMVLLGLDVPELVRQVALIPKWLFLTRLFWFVLGMVVGFHLAACKQFLARTRWLWLGGVLVLIPLGVWEWERMLGASGQPWVDHRETVLDAFYSLSVLMAFVAFNQARLPGQRLFSDLGPKSFGIYLAHIPVMSVVARGVYHVAPALLGIQPLFLAIIFSTGLGIPLLLMWVANQPPVRRYYTYVFG